MKSLIRSNEGFIGQSLFRSDLIFCTGWSMNGIELIFRFEDGLSFKSWRIISYSNLIYNLVLTRTVETFTSSNLDANSYVFIYSSIKFIIINIIISYDDPSIMKALSQFFEYHWTKLTPYFCRRKKEETLKKLNNIIYKHNRTQPSDETLENSTNETLNETFENLELRTRSTIPLNSRHESSNRDGASPRGGVARSFPVFADVAASRESRGNGWKCASNASKDARRGIPKAAGGEREETREDSSRDAQIRR